MAARRPWTERLKDQVRKHRGITLSANDARALRERIEHDHAAEFLRVLDQVPDNVWPGLNKIVPGLQDVYRKIQRMHGQRTSTDHRADAPSSTATSGRDVP